MKRIQLLARLTVRRAAMLDFQHCLQPNNAKHHTTFGHFKNISFLLLLLATYGTLQAQRSGSLSAYGGRFVGFTVDGDTKTGYAKIYPANTPYFVDSDWFKTPTHVTPDARLGRGMIDVSDSANLRARLQAGENIAFTKRMVGNPYDIGIYLKDGGITNDVDTQFLVDAIYFRDYYNNDYTSFTSAAKNGQNPNDWQGGLGNTNGKSDIIDVFTHVRTSGINSIDPTLPPDSVWFFAGVAINNTTGERHFDIEVFREPITFTPSANGTPVNFVSKGIHYGHSKWELDKDGNVTRTGDLIISVSYKSGTAPEIDFRIWVAKSTYDSIAAKTLKPKTFKLDGRFEPAGDGIHGYAEITGETTGEIWGSGVSNFSAASNQDTTYSTPWGTINTSGAWSETYDRLQFVEIGLNFSRFGMNPFQYVTSFCSSPYASIMVKSKQSSSISAGLEDFVGPVPFSVKSIIPYSVTPQTLTCDRPNPKLNWAIQGRNYYRVVDPEGKTIYDTIDFRNAATAADRFLTVSKPGTYKIHATNFVGCPSMDSITVTVGGDTTKPTAAALMGWGRPYYFLNGQASVTGESFGSSSLSYAWTGPTGAPGFPSTDRQPFLANAKEDVVLGDYHLTVTQARNGCKATSMINVNLLVLASNDIKLQGKLINGTAQLSWNTSDVTQAASFEIERSTNGVQFVKVGHVTGAVGTKRYSFMDKEPVSGHIQYRIKSVAAMGSPLYSNTVTIQGGNIQSLVLSRQLSSNQVYLQLKNASNKDLQVKVLSLDGRLLMQQNFSAEQARTSGSTLKLQLPATMANQAVIVAVYQDAYLLEARKL